MKFFAPKVHLVPTPRFQAGTGGGHGATWQPGQQGAGQAPTAAAPGLMTDAFQGIEGEDGKIILGN